MGESSAFEAVAAVPTRQPQSGTEDVGGGGFAGGSVGVAAGVLKLEEGGSGGGTLGRVGANW